MEIFLRLHFIPLLSLDIDEITTIRVSKALDVYRAGHSEASAITWRRYLRRLFGWAVESKRILFIPWEQKALGKMKAAGRPRTILPPERWAAWLDAVDLASGGKSTPCALMLRMMLICGLREREVLLARWEGLNFEISTYVTVLPTMGGESVPRAVPGWMLELLRPLAQPTGWMFPNPKTGRPWVRGHCHRIVEAANQAVGLLGVTQKGLRAGFARVQHEFHSSVALEIMNRLALAPRGGHVGGVASDAEPRWPP
jgi:integrase